MLRCCRRWLPLRVSLKLSRARDISRWLDSLPWTTRKINAVISVVSRQLLIHLRIQSRPAARRTLLFNGRQAASQTPAWCRFLDRSIQQQAALLSKPLPLKGEPCSKAHWFGTVVLPRLYFMVLNIVCPDEPCYQDKGWRDVFDMSKKKKHLGKQYGGKAQTTVSLLALANSHDSRREFTDHDDFPASLSTRLTQD